MSEYAPYCVSIAMVSIALLAWDIGRRWLQERAASRVGGAALGTLRAELQLVRDRLDNTDKLNAAVFTDWKKEFVRLEREWKALEARAQGQFAGTVAQLESQQRKGFGR